ncbi:transposase [Rhizobium favelukesii]|uniref:Membrane protein n=1 Tax=Rhizobium favelukesii TaxID=348824 RepID=W6RSM8_9HYPH|nr:putative membrane protein [Rhizobium favelukesii]
MHQEHSQARQYESHLVCRRARNALADRRITACIPSKANRKVPIPHDVVLYKQRHKIENMFGKLKDWRRIHTRYDRCAHTFFSSICIAAAVIFWL